MLGTRQGRESGPTVSNVWMIQQQLEQALFGHWMQIEYWTMWKPELALCIVKGTCTSHSSGAERTRRRSCIVGVHCSGGGCEAACVCLSGKPRSSLGEYSRIDIAVLDLQYSTTVL